MIALHIKYRPSTFEEVVGHKDVISSIKEAVKTGSHHAYLLTGPSGVGKTTLARIMAKELGTSDQYILEIDAATHTGIDSMREIMDSVKHRPFESSNRTVIVDEAHALSTQTIQSLLKSMEEPPNHLYWILCTTNASKIPNTIKTRCLHYNLKPLSNKDINTEITFILGEEGFNLEEDDIDTIIDYAQGSMRAALASLEKILRLGDGINVKAVLDSESESIEIVELCRYLIAGKLNWGKMMNIVKELETAGYKAESIRIIVLNYMTSVLKNLSDIQSAKRSWVLNVTECFFETQTTGLPSEKMTPIVVALGRVMESRK